MKLILNLTLLLLLIIGLASTLTNPCGRGSQNFHSHPEDDTKYIQCTQWGQMFIFNCPEGLKWDSQILSCEKRFKFVENFGTRATGTTGRMISQIVSQTPQHQQAITTQIMITQQQKQNIQQKQASMMQQNFPQPIMPQQTNTLQQPQSMIQQINQQPLITQQQQQSTQSTIQTTQPNTVLILQTQQQQQPSSPMTSISEGFQTFQSSNFVSTTESSPIISITPLNGKCDIITIKNSIVSIVNGVYNKISNGMYKRSDDLRLPGLVASVRNQWCISYSFTLSDLEHMNQATFNSACSNLECCILVSDSNPNFDIADLKRQWKINLLENKGQIDQNVRIECDSISKNCINVPFCPPECLVRKGDCDVCECNGKPFFGSQQQQTQTITQSQSQLSQQQQPSMMQLNPQQPQAIQTFGQQPMQVLQQSGVQKIKTLSSQIMSQTFPSETERELILPESNNSSANFKFFLVTSCEQVACPDDMLCATRRNCDSCNPVCFPPNKISHEHAVKLTCDNIRCPNNFRCLFDNSDQLIKCVEDRFFQMKGEDNSLNEIIETTTSSSTRRIMTTTSQRMLTATEQRMINEMVRSSNIKLTGEENDLEKQKLISQLIQQQNQIEQQKRLEKELQERQLLELMEKEKRKITDGVNRQTQKPQRSGMSLEEAINSLLEERKVDPKDKDNVIRQLLNELNQQPHQHVNPTTIRPAISTLGQQQGSSFGNQQSDIMTNQQKMGIQGMQQQQNIQSQHSMPSNMQITDKNMVIPENISQRDKQQLMQQIMIHQQQIEMQKELEKKQAEQQLRDLQDKIRGRTVVGGQTQTSTIKSSSNRFGIDDQSAIQQFNQQTLISPVQPKPIMDLTTTSSLLIVPQPQSSSIQQQIGSNSQQSFPSQTFNGLQQQSIGQNFNGQFNNQQQQQVIAVTAQPQPFFGAQFSTSTSPVQPQQLVSQSTFGQIQSQPQKFFNDFQTTTTNVIPQLFGQQQNFITTTTSPQQFFNGFQTTSSNIFGQQQSQFLGITTTQSSSTQTFSQQPSFISTTTLSTFPQLFNQQQQFFNQFQTTTPFNQQHLTTTTTQTPFKFNQPQQQPQSSQVFQQQFPGQGQISQHQFNELMMQRQQQQKIIDQQKQLEQQQQQAQQQLIQRMIQQQQAKARGF